MWEPDEQMLLRAPVAYKDKEKKGSMKGGTLFITPRRVAWQQQGVSELNPSIAYANIDVLQQTPETSKRLVLRITTKPPPAKEYSFEFTSPKALAERNAIKDKISELRARALAFASNSSTPIQRTTSTIPSLSPTPVATPPVATQGRSPIVKSPLTPNSRNASPLGNNQASWRIKELEARKKLLSAAPDSEASNRKRQRELQTLHKELVIIGKNVTEEEFWASAHVKHIRSRLEKESSTREGQQKGKSSRMVELRPGQQEGSDLKYILTSQMIHNIFTQYPYVKRAYEENVPDKITEGKFWKRFIASEFFHRSRTGGRSQMAAPDDIFDKCLQEEDLEISKAPEDIRMEKLKRSIDLTASIEDHMESGNAPDFTMIAGRDSKVLPLIRRFNIHSMRVLETPPLKATNKPKNDENELEKEIMLEDLVDEAPPERIRLDIQDTGRYFESQSGKKAETNMSEDDAARLLDSFKNQFRNWQPGMTKSVMKSKVADRVCHELTQTVKRRIRRDEKSFGKDTELPPPAQLKTQSYHLATNEILRHFWSSYEPYRQEKNARMAEGLERQKRKLPELYAMVKSYEADANRCKMMLQPVRDAVDRALESAKKKAKKK